MTVGEYTYTTDERFMARHNRETDEWVLVIKYVQERDAGIYECQIPSSVPRSYPINLNIVGKLISNSFFCSLNTNSDKTFLYAFSCTSKVFVNAYLNHDGQLKGYFDNELHFIEFFVRFMLDIT